MTVKGEPGVWRIDRLGVELGTHRQNARCTQAGRSPIIQLAVNLTLEPEPKGEHGPRMAD